MPVGNRHTVATLSATSILTAQAIVTMDAGLAVVALGCLCGLVLSPDLDVDGGSISIHHVRETIGAFGAWAWEEYWTLYAGAIAHRSWLSHFPGIGTMVRLAYFIPTWGVLWSLLAGFWWAWAWVAGLVLSDFIHALMDVIWSAWKRIWK